jgi:hypothetical protein
MRFGPWYVLWNLAKTNKLFFLLCESPDIFISSLDVRDRIMIFSKVGFGSGFFLYQSRNRIGIFLAKSDSDWDFFGKIGFGSGFFWQSRIRIGIFLAKPDSDRDFFYSKVGFWSGFFFSKNGFGSGFFLANTDSDWDFFSKVGFGSRGGIGRDPINFVQTTVQPIRYDI